MASPKASTHRLEEAPNPVLRQDGKTCVSDGIVELFNPAEIAVTRYRYRGNGIPTPWTCESGNAA